jgi:hypothetical protein
MAHEEASRPNEEEPVPDYQQALSKLSNPELLSALDLALLELEKRLEHASVVLTWGSAGRCCATQTRLPRLSSRHGMGGA